MGQNFDNIFGLEDPSSSKLFLENLENAYREKISSLSNFLENKYKRIPKILMAHSFFGSSKKIDTLGVVILFLLMFLEMVFLMLLLGIFINS